MLAIFAYLLAAAGVTSAWVYALLLLVYPLVHLFLQVKGAYGLTFGGALWRTGFLERAAGVTLKPLLPADPAPRPPRLSRRAAGAGFSCRAGRPAACASPR